MGYLAEFSGGNDHHVGRIEITLDSETSHIKALAAFGKALEKDPMRMRCRGRSLRSES
jgi:hypothetical protein